MEEKKWVELSEFGKVVQFLGNYRLVCDNELSNILGWSGAPIDDLGELFGIKGIVENNGHEAIVLSMWRSLSCDKDYMYAVSIEMSGLQVSSVKNWIKRRVPQLDLFETVG